MPTGFRRAQCNCEKHSLNDTRHAWDETHSGSGEKKRLDIHFLTKIAILYVHFVTLKILRGSWG